MTDKDTENITTARCPDCGCDIVITGNSVNLPDNCGGCGKAINYAKINAVMIMRIVDYLASLHTVARKMSKKDEA